LSEEEDEDDDAGSASGPFLDAEDPVERSSAGKT
jgi:hypothetical protein